MNYFDYNPISNEKLQASDNNITRDKNIIYNDFIIRYDLNKVTYEELLHIPGIGPVKAKAIIDYQQNHSFNHPNDLKKVKGIGDKTFNKLSEYFFTNTTQDSVKFAQEVDVTNINKYNLNTITYEELLTLKGIGPKKANDIISYRNNNGKFSSVDELINVSGIGNKTLNQIKNYIFIGE